jgi:ribosomal protein L27
MGHGLLLLGFLGFGRGQDDTLYATITGTVEFRDKGRKGKVVSVVPA